MEIFTTGFCIGYSLQLLRSCSGQCPLIMQRRALKSGRSSKRLSSTSWSCKKCELYHHIFTINVLFIHGALVGERSEPQHPQTKNMKNMVYILYRHWSIQSHYGLNTTLKALDKPTGLTRWELVQLHFLYDWQNKSLNGTLHMFWILLTSTDPLWRMWSSVSSPLQPTVTLRRG